MTILPVAVDRILFPLGCDRLIGSRSVANVQSISRFRRLRSFGIAVLLGVGCFSASLVAQGVAVASSEPAIDLVQPPVVTAQEKWDNFLRETAGPVSFSGSVFNAGFSQLTQTDPKYGVGGRAFAERFGASWADIATQNFFGDFVIASVLHEDPVYHRLGRSHSFWHRFAYAVSRTVIIRKDSGGNAFNLDSIGGSAASSAISNIYYPAASRGGKAALTHFGIDVADNGFVNLAPEFWPDFRDWITRRHRAASH
jgi:hypothetical protein